jgi:glutamate/tyrosine decarboxylase-like PLP-dependent enzyme
VSDQQQLSDLEAMFGYDENLTEFMLQYGRRRLALDPVPLGLGLAGTPDPAALAALLCEDGNDPRRVVEVFYDQVAPSMIPADSTSHLAFIAHAPTQAARLFDMLVSAGSMSASHWSEASGAVIAENQTLRLLADRLGMPPQAGGCFVSGGSAANLSALVVAREHHQHTIASDRRPRIAVSDEAHASVALALRVIGVDALKVPTDDHRLTGASLEAALAADPRPEEVIGVVATAGTTNAGIVDDFRGIAGVARSADLWMHVDGAYGAAAMFVEELRGLFDGIEQADSVVIDPHKWLFAPYDCGAVLYREPELARQVFSQRAAYLETVTGSDGWSPADYAFHLTRRPRGLPLWFSLAVHGTRAYSRAIAAAIETARECAQMIEELPDLELIRPPGLSVVLFRRRGWGAVDYSAWAQRLFAAQVAFVSPTTWEGAAAARLAFLHPNTSLDLVQEVLASMGESAQSV